MATSGGGLRNPRRADLLASAIADARTRLRPAAPARDRARLGDPAEGVVARRAGGGCARRRKRGIVRCYRRPLARHNGSVYRARHETCFSLASRVIVMVGGRVLVEGTPAKSPGTSACARSTSARRGQSAAMAVMARPLLALSRFAPATAPPIVLDGVSFALPERGGLAVLGRNGVGKSTLCSPSWATPRSIAAAFYGAARTSRPRRRIAAPAPASAGWRRNATSFSSLTVEENLTVAARDGRWNLAAVYDLFPRLAERRRNWATNFRRRAADAGDRARAHDQSGAASARRAARGPAPIVVEELPPRSRA